jgi:hypothetical protein
MSHGMLAIMLLAGMEGQWAGTIASGDTLVRASVVRRGDTLRMAIGEPHKCQVPAEILIESEDEARLRFNPSSSGGAFCQGLYPGDMRMAKTDGGIRVTFVRAGRTWEGVLSGTPAP